MTECSDLELLDQGLYLLSSIVLLLLYLVQLGCTALPSGSKQHNVRCLHWLGLVGMLLASGKAVDPRGCHGLLSVMALWALDSNLVCLVVTCAFLCSFAMVLLAYQLLGKVHRGPLERPVRFGLVVVVLVVPLFLVPNVMLILEDITGKEWYRGIQQLTYAFSLTAFVLCITYARHRFLSAFRNLFPPKPRAALFSFGPQPLLESQPPSDADTSGLDIGPGGTSSKSSSKGSHAGLDSFNSSLNTSYPVNLHTPIHIDYVIESTPPNHLLSVSDLRSQQDLLANLTSKVRIWVSWVFPLAVLLCLVVVALLSWQGVHLLLESHTLPLPASADLLDILYCWLVQSGYGLVLWFSWLPVRPRCCRAKSKIPRRERAKSQSYADLSRHGAGSSCDSRVDLGSFPSSPYEGMADEADNGDMFDAQDFNRHRSLSADFQELRHDQEI
eukprot:g2417.t1